MATYHAGKHGIPICGTKGSANRWNVICLSANDWNNTATDLRCSKCVCELKKKAVK
jgi:hypothetical protein